MSPLSRRRFLQATAAATGGALVVGCRIGGGGWFGGDPDATFQANAWVGVHGDGRVTVTVDDVEMGQGVMTALPMIVAEELAVDWETVTTAYATEDPSSWPRSISTGGSSSMRTSWMPMRRAGAAAREMLVRAAAEEWEVDPAECRAESGTVVHEPSGRQRRYGQLVETAAALPVPEEPTLRDPDGYTLVGTGVARVDSPAKVDGSHVYGLDVRVDGMRYAMIARSPVLGGTVRGFDDAAARAVPGVVEVVRVSNGIAVLAENSWAARRGRDALEIEWDDGPNAGFDDAALEREFRRLAGTAGRFARNDGNANINYWNQPAARRIQAVYRAPFLAHAPMEPVNCTAHYQGERCEVWAPTQRLTAAQQVAAEAAELPIESVVMHAIPPGGGFGRRLENDYVREAVEVSRAAGGIPVQVVWTREDDLRHGVFRPAAYHRIMGAVGLDGAPVAWNHRVVAPSVSEWQRPGSVSQGDAPDGDAVAGLDDLPYAIPNIRVDHVLAPRRVPLGWWRAVGYTHTTFAYESFIDELAHLAGADPYRYRRRLVADRPRYREVLDAAMLASDWGAPLPAGRGRGIALFHGFESYVAQVAEVTVEEDGAIRVDRVSCAVDCGRAINPAIIRSQVESAVAFGLSAALYGRITLADGGFVEGNFDRYRVLRMPEMPRVDVVIVDSAEDPTGIGEPGVPPVAPAVANAVFAATGRRLRELPLRMEPEAPVT